VNIFKRSPLSSIVGFFSIFYSYIGVLSFAVYPYMLLKIRFVMPVFDWLVLISIVMLFSLSAYISGFVEAAQVYRFHWGFLIFYFFFRTRGRGYDMRALLIILLLMTFIESMLVNSLIAPENLPNYPNDRELSWSHFSDIWQRVYGVGGNPSVLSVLLVALLSITNPGTVIIMATSIIIILIGSGSGAVAFIGYLIYKYMSKLRKSPIIIATFIFLLALFYLLPDIDVIDKFFYKISYKYLGHLFELKQLQISDAVSNMDIFALLIGTANIENMGGDFLWLSFFVCQGFAGSVLMLAFFLKRINSVNGFGIFIIFATTIHYFVLFSLPVQFLTGYLFATRTKKVLNKRL